VQRLQTRIYHTVYNECCEFFRIRLLTSTAEEIEKIIEDMDKEVKSLKENMLRSVWYMRGGVTYTEIVNMSYDERVSINKIIEDNLETAKKTGRDFW